MPALHCISFCLATVSLSSLAVFPKINGVLQELQAEFWRLPMLKFLLKVIPLQTLKYISDGCTLLIIVLSVK